MYLAILAAAAMRLLSVSTFTVEGTVYVTGQPGCTVQALHNDPSAPVVVCGDHR